MQNRSKVIRDILNHRAETTVVTDERLSELEDELHESSDAQVKSIWFDWVGEWLNSMDRWFSDEYRDDAGELLWEPQYESPAEWQFDKLTSGEDVGYGYTHPAY